MASDSLDKIRAVFTGEIRIVRAELDACKAHIAACTEQEKSSSGDAGWQRNLMTRLETCLERLRELSGELELQDENLRAAENDVADTIELIYRSFPDFPADSGDGDSASSISPLA